jgi:hypothetical protein
MKALVVLALCSGCATTWIATQASGTERVWDEHARDELVPQPGLDERLTVSLPLAIEYTTVPGATAGSTVAGPPRPFALACSAEQRGTSVRYHSAFRYGSFWKKSTAISFLIEGAIASAMLLTASSDRPNNYLYGGFFAADAVVTAAIFFIPRKEVYREEPIAMITPLRTDCPDGLALAINGTAYPVDAAGHIGDVAEAALAEWMQAPQGVVETTFDGQAQVLPIGAREQCAWQREHTSQPCLPGELTPRVAVATLRVSPGTLASIDH